MSSIVDPVARRGVRIVERFILRFVKRCTIRVALSRMLAFVYPRITIQPRGQVHPALALSHKEQQLSLEDIAKINTYSLPLY